MDSYCFVIKQKIAGCGAWRCRIVVSFLFGLWFKKSLERLKGHHLCNRFSRKFSSSRAYHGSNFMNCIDRELSSACMLIKQFFILCFVDTPEVIGCNIAVLP